MMECLLLDHPFCTRKYPFNWGGLSSGEKINTFR